MKEKNIAKEDIILVTGGAGYKGSTLCRDLLMKGYKIRVFDNFLYGGRSIAGLVNHENFDYYKGDITNPSDVKEALKDITHIVHLAAIVGDKPCERDPKRAVEVNYKGTMLLAEEFSKKKKNEGHFLFASTCSNYGITDPNSFANEDSELNPVSLYAETKIDCERFLTDMWKSKKLSPVMLRFSTAFGVSGRTRFDLTVNSFTYEALRDKRIIAFAENAWRPFIHVSDMSRIYLKMLEYSPKELGGKILNAGWNEQNFTKKQIIQMIMEVIGEFEVDYVNTIEDRRSYRVDFSRIYYLLQFPPRMTIQKGVAELAKAIKTGLLTETDFERNKLK